MTCLSHLGIFLYSGWTILSFNCCKQYYYLQLLMNWCLCYNCWLFICLDKQVFRLLSDFLCLVTSVCDPSGGDDRRVLLWHMEKAIHGRSKPVKLKGEHLSNIFCLAFDSTNRKVFSGGESNTWLLSLFALSSSHIKTLMDHIFMMDYPPDRWSDI